MKKKVLIGVGIVVVLIVAAVFYLNNRNRTLSPPGQAIGAMSGDTVSVEYSRPSVRDRLIFGEEEEGALQPYGVYWRLGANEPTFLSVSYDFRFGDSEIDAGKYVIYAIPRKGEMELRLNSDLRLWGYTEPDYSQDLATEIERVNPSDHTEQFTIEAQPDSIGTRLVFSWDKYQWELLLEKQ
ncbi:DUF2911 domain-containing protein [Ekhidna sp. MALMAid0563]|uniref:DUF2911 domain-containing protein n=1 Tax=Ekhidna sp. MALMAid0563 TaxID=3143937 RepID=UPI0032DE5AAA